MSKDEIKMLKENVLVLYKVLLDKYSREASRGPVPTSHFREKEFKPAYKEFDNIKEFKGFIPKHLPDQDIILILFHFIKLDSTFIILMFWVYHTQIGAMV